ncbi:MAG: Tyrosine phenol-lyase [Fimbriimonadaceae bacterium]|nr:Tyrosine phenol-lyase [Fimbriimonadaceae bacterium]
MPEIIEPFRIKSVEPIRFTTPEQRERILEAAHYNLFLVDADDVLIDLLTDSGTSAMSAAQWGAIMVGDESYAGSRSFHRFEAAVRDIWGLKHVIPTHQGRAAEKILMSLLGGAGKAIPSNNHFDTTRANIEFSGAKAIDLVIDEAKNLDSTFPFKGNIDLEKLGAFLDANDGNVPLAMITVTNNTGGGQPVSMENIRAVSAVVRQRGIPFFIDSCRFAENAWFIKQREPGYADKTPKAIAQEMFGYADGATMSLKKDGFGNIGGFLAMNDDGLAEQARNLLILTEGFPTYGGLAGRDLEALAVGLEETLDERYLEYRTATVRYLADKLLGAGIRIVQPPGGHAVYIDAASFFPQIPPNQYPAQALVVELYRRGGIRAVEIGSVMFGKVEDGKELPATQELVRLALPRRVYTQAHVNYLADVIIEAYSDRSSATGYALSYQAPFLRHFTAHFKRY